ncbi:MAG: response regulator [Nitrososphaerales archaeon]
MAVQSKADFLIVDDSESVRMLIARMLRVLGHENVTLASNAKQALALFKDNFAKLKNPIVILDIVLPDLSGDIVARKILSMNNSTKIILVTAEDRNEALTMDVIRQGAFGYIQKPIRLSSLREILEGI